MIGLQLPGSDLSLLALGAHPDDIEIGCGGTLLSLCSQRRVSAHVAVMTGTAQRRHEAETAARAFLVDAATTSTFVHDLPDGRLPARWDDVKQALEALARSVQPDLILAPRADDAHQDHRLLGTMVTTVWRDSLVLHYEIPKWDGDLRPVTHYVPLHPDTAHRKIDLLDECFPSQTGRDWWDREMFVGLMRLRGVEVRQRYAEGFVASKVRMDP